MDYQIQDYSRGALCQSDARQNGRHRCVFDNELKGVNISEHKGQGCCRCLPKAMIESPGHHKTKERLRQYPLSKSTKSQPELEPIRGSQTLPTAEFGQRQIFAPTKSAYICIPCNKPRRGQNSPKAVYRVYVIALETGLGTGLESGLERCKHHQR